MRRRVEAEGSPAVATAIREMLKQRADRWGDRAPIAARRLKRWDGGESLVFAPWEVHRLHLPQVRHNEHAYFRIDPNGLVTEVEPVRSAKDPLTIDRWVEVTA